MEPAGQGQGREQPCWSNPQGMQRGRRGFPWPQPCPVPGQRVSLRERENQAPWAPCLGRALAKGGGGGGGRGAAVSALLALAGCSGFLRHSSVHYARLAGLRLAAQGAGAHWDAGSRQLASSSALKWACKKETTRPCAWKTEAWLTVLFKSTARPPTGQPPRNRVMRRCTRGDEDKWPRSWLSWLCTCGRVMEGGQMWHEPHGCQK